MTPRSFLFILPILVATRDPVIPVTFSLHPPNHKHPATLISSLAFTSYQWLETDRARKSENSARTVAERRFDELHALVHALLFDIYAEIEHRPGSTRARRLLAEKALLYLDTLLAEAEDDAELRYELAVAYMKIGDVQGNPVQANLGDTQGALSSYRKAGRQLTRSDVSSIAEQRGFDLALLHDKFGEVLAHAGEIDDALDRHLRGLELRKRNSPSARAAKVEEGLARSYHRIGNVLLLSGDAEAASAEFDGALEILDRRRRSNPSIEIERAFAVCHLSRGDARAEQRDSDGALDDYRTAVDSLIKLSESDPLNVRWLRDLGIARSRLVRAHMNRGEDEDALRQCEHASAIARTIRRADPADADAQRELSLVLLNRGYLESRTGDNTSALAAYAEAKALIDTRRASDPDNHRIVRDAWMVRFRRGCLHEENGDLSSADHEFRRAQKIGDELRLRDPDNSHYARFCGLSHRYAGRVAERLGNSSYRDACYRSAESAYRKLAEDSASPRATTDLNSLLEEWAVAVQSTGDVSRASRIRARSVP